MISKMEIVELGKDYNGYIWYWDSLAERIFCEGDIDSRKERGYCCDSLEQARLMLLNEEIP